MFRMPFEYRSMSATSTAGETSLARAASPAAQGFSHSLERDRDTLPDTDTHRAQRKPPLCALQLIHRGRDKTRAAHAERMTERNRAAVRIDARIIVGDAEHAQHRQPLRCERFVEFDHI